MPVPGGRASLDVSDRGPPMIYESSSSSGTRSQAARPRERDELDKAASVRLHGYIDTIGTTGDGRR